MTSSLAKCKQIIGAHFQTFFSTIFLFFDVPQYSIDLIILKTDDKHFTLTTKKSLHIIFKLECGPMHNVMVALPNTGGAVCSTPQSLADAHH